MKTSFIALFMVGAVLSGNSLLANEGHHEGMKGMKHDSKTAIVKQQTNCPVMTQNKINKKLYVDAKGKRIYVCCKGCLPMIKRNPEKYLKQLKKNGIAVANIPTAKK
jgi:YHS domain-containing protein